MKLVAGLGNPGPRYADSRHNVGFRVIDALGKRWGTGVSRHDRKFDALVGQTQRAGTSVLLLKPTTFMNLSGRSVAAAWRYYKLDLSDLLVAYDDLDLPLGQWRVRATGSAGGHRGMTDIIRHVGDERVPRVRLGIGKVDRTETVEHVLGRFAPDELPLVSTAVTAAADAIECWLAHGINQTMNEFNRRTSGTAGTAEPDSHAAKGDGS